MRWTFYFIFKGWYRNTSRLSVRPSVSYDSSEMAHGIFLKLWGIVKYHGGMMHVFSKFWKNPRWPSGIEKIGKKCPFSAILMHFMSYLGQICFNWSKVDIRCRKHVKVTIWIICREVRFKMADWRPFWIFENGGWHQTAPTDLWGCENNWSFYGLRWQSPKCPGFSRLLWLALCEMQACKVMRLNNFNLTLACTCHIP